VGHQTHHQVIPMDSKCGVSEQASLRSGEQPTEAEQRILEVIQGIMPYLEDITYGDWLGLIRELHLTQSPVVMERVEEILNPGEENG
jgi:hypothetical protein